MSLIDARAVADPEDKLFGWLVLLAYLVIVVDEKAKI